MPKRKHDEEYYLRKIKKLEKKMERNRRSHAQSPVSSMASFSDAENINPQEQNELTSDYVDPPPVVSDTTPEVINKVPISTDAVPSESETNTVPELDAEPALSPDVLQALGDLMPEKPKYGPDINNDVARIWNTILKNGLTKDNKQKLEKNIPENCSLLRAPILNPEIVASVNDTIINRDKKIEIEQNQLGMGLTILGDTLSMLINNNNIDRLKLISQLSDAGRILTDLHFTQTRSRKNLIFPALDKKFIEIVKNVERDEYLYGNNLSEKIKVLKACQRSGQSIKKPTATVTRQGNFNGPPRYNHQRTIQRVGPKKAPSSYQVRKFNQPQPAARKSKVQPALEKNRAQH